MGDWEWVHYDIGDVMSTRSKGQFFSKAPPPRPPQPRQYPRCTIFDFDSLGIIVDFGRCYYSRKLSAELYRGENHQSISRLKNSLPFFFFNPRFRPSYLHFLSPEGPFPFYSIPYACHNEFLLYSEFDHLDLNQYWPKRPQ